MNTRDTKCWKAKTSRVFWRLRSCLWKKKHIIEQLDQHRLLQGCLVLCVLLSGQREGSVEVNSLQKGEYKGKHDEVTCEPQFHWTVSPRPWVRHSLYIPAWRLFLPSSSSSSPSLNYSPDSGKPELFPLTACFFSVFSQHYCLRMGFNTKLSSKTHVSRHNTAVLLKTKTSLETRNLVEVLFKPAPWEITAALGQTSLFSFGVKVVGSQNLFNPGRDSKSTCRALGLEPNASFRPLIQVRACRKHWQI